MVPDNIQFDDAPNPDIHADEVPTLSDDEFTLDEVIGTKLKLLIYEYDLGDSWVHDVKVQIVMVVDE